MVRSKSSLFWAYSSLSGVVKLFRCAKIVLKVLCTLTYYFINLKLHTLIIDRKCILPTWHGRVLVKEGGDKVRIDGHEEDCDDDHKEPQVDEEVVAAPVDNLDDAGKDGGLDGLGVERNKKSWNSIIQGAYNATRPGTSALLYCANT